MRDFNLDVTPCLHCEKGWRHVIGNCVLCGDGPSPAAIEHPPKTLKGKYLALRSLFNGEFEPFTDWDKAVEQLSASASKEDNNEALSEFHTYQRLKLKYGER